MRASTYLIPIKLEDKDNQYILIHGYTGAIDLVSESLLKKIKAFSSEDDFELSTLQLLMTRGYITNKTQEEEYAYVNKVAQILHKRNELIVKKDFTILITYNCNFRCPYCFEKETIEKEPFSQEITISEKLVDKAFEAILEIEPNEQQRNKVIQLFGGEPLLKENRKIVEYIVNKGEQLGFTFVATTNGYDLDYYEDLLKVNRIQGVQITIDGMAKIHDKRRVHAVYKDSFNKIIDNIKKSLNNGVAIRVRINIDSQNIDEILKLNKYFNEMGFYSFEKFSVYAEYISGSLNFNPNGYEFQSREDFTRKDFLKIVDSSDNRIKHDLQIYTNIYDAIQNKKSVTLSSIHCTAQSGFYVFDPFGYIYSCLEAVGNKNEIIGSYLKGITWTEEKNKWFGRNISFIERCSRCRYSLLCGGGCFAKTKTNSSRTDSYCDDFSIRLKSIVRKIHSHFNSVD